MQLVSTNNLNMPRLVGFITGIPAHIQEGYCIAEVVTKFCHISIHHFAEASG